MRLFTSRYQQFHPSQGIAVRTTVGLPRWRLAYPLDHAARLITPQRWMLGLDYDRYTQVYRKQLAGHGLDAVTAELRSIAVTAGDDRLVLLCFEDLTDNSMWCHRTMFAHWWGEHSGEEVTELATVERRSRASQPDPTLF